MPLRAAAVGVGFVFGQAVSWHGQSRLALLQAASALRTGCRFFHIFDFFDWWPGGLCGDLPARRRFDGLDFFHLCHFLDGVDFRNFFHVVDGADFLQLLDDLIDFLGIGHFQLVQRIVSGRLHGEDHLAVLAADFLAGDFIGEGKTALTVGTNRVEGHR